MYDCVCCERPDQAECTVYTRLQHSIGANGTSWHCQHVLYVQSYIFKGPSFWIDELFCISTSPWSLLDSFLNPRQLTWLSRNLSWVEKCQYSRWWQERSNLGSATSYSRTVSLLGLASLNTSSLILHSLPFSLLLPPVTLLPRPISAKPTSSIRLHQDLISHNQPKPLHQSITSTSPSPCLTQVASP